MEERIKRVIKNLKISYIVFWGLAVLLILLGELDIIPVGMYADDVRMTYYLETAGILLAAISVPLSLKLFSWVLIKKIDKASFAIALGMYFRWSGVRLLILAIPTVINLLIYYLTLSNTGLLCALLTLTASLFCVPGEKRLRKELKIDKEDTI